MGTRSDALIGLPLTGFKITVSGFGFAVSRDSRFAAEPQKLFGRAFVSPPLGPENQKKKFRNNSPFDNCITSLTDSMVYYYD